MLIYCLRIAQFFKYAMKFFAFALHFGDIDSVKQLLFYMVCNLLVFKGDGLFIIGLVGVLVTVCTWCDIVFIYKFFMGFIVLRRS